MKILTIKYLLLSLVIVAFMSCEDEDEKRIPELKDAANVRIQLDPDYAFLSANDLENAKLVFSVFSENDNLQSVELSATYFDFSEGTSYDRTIIKTFDQADFDEGNGAIRNVTLTADELANAFGLSGATALGGGDRFDFFNVTTLDNGLVFPDTLNLPTGEFINTTPNIINSAATTSYTTGFTAYVSCPFVAADAVGTYAVVEDAWADWDPGEQLEVVANADGTGVIVKGMYSKFRNDERGPYDVEILVDAGSGIATVLKQPAWEYYWYAGSEGYVTGSVEGGGFVFSCSGVITVLLKHTVNAGSFGSYTLTLQKI